jgi:hypothetical protein
MRHTRVIETEKWRIKIEELNGVSCLTNAGMMSLILQDSIRDLTISTAPSQSSKGLTASIL